MEMGDLIYLKRKEKNMTQEQLAEKLNVARQTVGKWENNESLPDLNSLKGLAVTLNFSIDKALGIETEENGEDDNELDDKFEWLIIGGFAVGNALGIALDNYMLGYVFAVLGLGIGFALKAFKKA